MKCQILLLGENKKDYLISSVCCLLDYSQESGKGYHHLQQYFSYIETTEG